MRRWVRRAAPALAPGLGRSGRLPWPIVLFLPASASHGAWARTAGTTENFSRVALCCKNAPRPMGVVTDGSCCEF